MEFLKETLIQRERMLAQMIKKKEEALKKAPIGSLRANRHGKGVQYFHYTTAGNPGGVYLKKSEQKLAKALAQKEYDKKILKSACREYTLLKQLNQLYRQNYPEDVYEKIAYMKRNLVDPVWIPDDMYEEQWRSLPYAGLGFSEESPEFYSDRGERMRSKSELLIANALNKQNIPYKYECPLELGSYGVVYPDFTVLHVKKRKEIYWEHLGLMDDQEYREKNLNKIIRYEYNNCSLGNRLIISFETAKQPLSTRLIEVMIHQYLLT